MYLSINVLFSNAMKKHVSLSPLPSFPKCNSFSFQGSKEESDNNLRQNAQKYSTPFLQTFKKFKDCMWPVRRGAACCSKQMFPF